MQVEVVRLHRSLTTTPLFISILYILHFKQVLLIFNVIGMPKSGTIKFSLFMSQFLQNDKIKMLEIHYSRRMPYNL